MKLKVKKVVNLIKKINKIESKTNNKFKAVKRSVNFFEKDLYFKDLNIPENHTYNIIRDKNGLVCDIEKMEE